MSENKIKKTLKTLRSVVALNLDICDNSRMMLDTEKDMTSDKPFVCPVPGCKKRYKNINGMKYHAKHSHKQEIR